MLEMRHLEELKLLIIKNAKKFLLNMMITDGYKNFLEISSKTSKINREIIAYKLGYKWYLLKSLSQRAVNPAGVPVASNSQNR